MLGQRSWRNFSTMRSHLTQFYRIPGAKKEVRFKDIDEERCTGGSAKIEGCKQSSMA
jgi:hypothetical protein